MVREIGSNSLYIKDKKIIKSVNPIRFKAIEKTNLKYNSWLPNTNIGVIDTETYVSYNGIIKIYALGFRTKLSNEPKIFYIDKNTMDSTSLIVSMVDELLRYKYKDMNFYCHNLSGYDVVFLVSTLLKYNETNTNTYDLSYVLRDEKIIKLTIKKGKEKFTLLNSYMMLTSSLEKLAKDFNVETMKSIFPPPPPTSLLTTILYFIKVILLIYHFTIR